MTNRPPQSSPERERKDGARSRPVHDHEFTADALALAEQSAGIGVWSIDLTTGLARGTAQFFRIMGLPPTMGPIPMDAIRALRHPEDRERVLSGFHRALEDGSDAYEIEYRIIRPDGSLRWVFGRGRVVRNRAGKPIRYSGIDLDITERKAAQAELARAKEDLERMNSMLEERVRQRTEELETEAKRRIEAELQLAHAHKMEAVGQLTGGVAHDFNNLLQVILGNLQVATMLLQNKAPPPPGMQREQLLLSSIEKSQKAARSAAQLVERLLAFSRRQRLEPTTIDVNARVRDMIDMIRRTLGESIEVKTAFTPALWTAFVDPGQLETALLNLVVNARDAMPEGGEVTIETSNVSVRPGFPEDVDAGEYVVLCVSDSGSGIPPDVLPRVFEPFFTTKETGKGSGLGLSMVYGFVTQSGGHVRIYSEVGCGSSVKLYLPRAGSDIAAPAKNVDDESEPALATARPGETILLVEDNEEVRRFGVSALEGLGYRVLPAQDGASALRLIDTTAPPDIDLLFTDVVLPGGISGRALADAVIARRPDLPVLFTTGYAQHAATGHGPIAPASHVLGKPYTLERLASTIRRALDDKDAVSPGD